MEKKQKSGRMLLTALIILAVPLVLAAAISAVVLQLVANGRMSVSAGTLCMIFVFAVVLIVALFMVRQLLSRLYNLVGDLEQITDKMSSMKDNILAQRKDETGQMMRSVNGMVVSFAKIMNNVKNAAQSLLKVSENSQNSFQDVELSMHQVGKEVNSIKRNTVSQSERSREISTQIKDMSSAVDEIEENIDTLTESTDKMKACSQKAEDIMAVLVSVNEASSKAIADMQAQADMTNQSAKQIHTVIDIIKGFSNQTNLLALNASIEAARAGEIGEGFAAVAEKIRILSEQSRKSLEKMNGIVNELIENSDVSMDITRKASEVFEKQGGEISQTEGIFVSLNQEIARVSSAIEGIDREVRELKGSKEVIGGGTATRTEAVKIN